MEIPRIIEEFQGKGLGKEPLNEPSEYKEVRYRWVVVTLTSLLLLLNGIINNAITPL
jgi:hypothetical protein